jgi:thymidylate kinase
MLITFSGIVGSGKSTNAKQAHRFLQEAGFPAVYLRFRFLKTRRILRALFAKEQNTAPLVREKAKLKRTVAPQRRQAIIKLTLARTLGYLWRIGIFRIFAAIRLRRKIIVIDRFYYDSLVHYSLTGRRERFYLWLMKKALPVPKLALLLIARPKTILRRRPNYDRAYVRQLYRNYQQIAREFPHLLVLQTDSFKNLTTDLSQHLRRIVGRAGESDPLAPKVLL